MRWDRDAALVQHFYGTDPGLMPLSVFLARLEAIGKVREELRPKTKEEMLQVISESVAELQAS